MRVVYGPGTFVNAAVEEIQSGLRERVAAAQARADRVDRAARALAEDQGRPRAEQVRLGRAARRLEEQRFTRDLLELHCATGSARRSRSSTTRTSSTALVFDPSRGATTPKARFAYLFPTSRSAVIQVRLKPGLSDARRARRSASCARRSA